ncbi:hypothetical protein EG329_006852 [Mollisiaceae sp. DMI_Dod_QoI]|nr:hypothetical protein EG329_006852 [Helotiales sp. DMI_Dod_QoI]
MSFGAHDSSGWESTGWTLYSQQSELVDVSDLAFVPKHRGTASVVPLEDREAREQRIVRAAETVLGPDSNTSLEMKLWMVSQGVSAFSSVQRSVLDLENFTMQFCELVANRLDAIKPQSLKVEVKKLMEAAAKLDDSVYNQVEAMRKMLDTLDVKEV